MVVTSWYTDSGNSLAFHLDERGTLHKLELKKYTSGVSYWETHPKVNTTEEYIFTPLV